jgi:hypothetical protein
MPVYSHYLQEKVRAYRKQGKTYSEINTLVGIHIPKSTLSLWCHDIQLTHTQESRISQFLAGTLERARRQAHLIQQERRKKRDQNVTEINRRIGDKVQEKDIAKIALAMLCLGEATKSAKSKSFSLGNSDPRILIFFLSLLKRCFRFDKEKVRCTLQCRAGQDIRALETYWSEAIGIPLRLFYKARIDTRTMGKPIHDSKYKGVLRVDYLDRSIQLDLESLVDMIYNQFH